MIEAPTRVRHCHTFIYAPFQLFDTRTHIYASIYRLIIRTIYILLHPIFRTLFFVPYFSFSFLTLFLFSYPYRSLFQVACLPLAPPLVDIPVTPRPHAMARPQKVGMTLMHYKPTRIFIYLSICIASVLI